ncbi:MAG: transposase [Candidatus Sulfotelmatobacter sp.]
MGTDCSSFPSALTYLLTLEDAHHFRKSRDVGCHLGLQPGRRNSGQSEPQMHISKEGNSGRVALSAAA